MFVATFLVMLPLTSWTVWRLFHDLQIVSEEINCWREIGWSTWPKAFFNKSFTENVSQEVHCWVICMTFSFALITFWKDIAPIIRCETTHHTPILWECSLLLHQMRVFIAVVAVMLLAWSLKWNHKKVLPRKQGFLEQTRLNRRQ